MELHRFWIIRTVAVVISETRSGFPLMFSKADCQFKVSGALMFMLILNSGVRNAYIILFMYLFCFFIIDKKKKVALTLTDFSAFQDLADKFLQKNIILSNWSSCLFFPRIRI